MLSSPEPEHSSEAFDTIAGLRKEVNELQNELNKVTFSAPVSLYHLTIILFAQF